MPWRQALLGVWPTRAFGQELPQLTQSTGKWPGVRIDGAVRTPGSVPQLYSLMGGAQHHRRGSMASLLETNDCTCLEPIVVAGRTCVGDFCHVPVTVEGVPCSALVDMGSTVTLVGPDLVPGWTQFEPTTVQLRTVTGKLAPMKGRGVLILTIGGRTVHHPVWLAAVQDPCILGLDFLRATGCQLDLEKGTLRFQGGPAVTMAPPNVSVSQPTRLLTQTVAAAETCNRDPPAPAACGTPPSPMHHGYPHTPAAECENPPPLLSPTQRSCPSPTSMTCLSMNTGHTPLA
ncbi:hypothetical protein AAFF_G00082580 [Aldrovandia affinis]|uniref:Retropepsins domain-containing protein n=1 Tax=Aldrovandia affinis TaxID=143900 RepID=A0AAD7T5B1_9TELE|nr:hypothetical protein AAFF_G00082580 [Aldrovandia affinis]